MSLSFLLIIAIFICHNSYSYCTWCEQPFIVQEFSGVIKYIRVCFSVVTQQITAVMEHLSSMFPLIKGVFTVSGITEMSASSHVCEANCAQVFHLSL